MAKRRQGAAQLKRSSRTSPLNPLFSICFYIPALSQSAVKPAPRFADFAGLDPAERVPPELRYRRAKEFSSSPTRCPFQSSPGGSGGLRKAQRASRRECRDAGTSRGSDRLLNAPATKAVPGRFCLARSRGWSWRGPRQPLWLPWREAR